MISTSGKGKGQKKKKKKKKVVCVNRVVENLILHLISGLKGGAKEMISILAVFSSQKRGKINKK